MTAAVRRGINLSDLRGAVSSPQRPSERGLLGDTDLLNQIGPEQVSAVEWIGLDIGYPIFNPEANNREYRGRINLGLNAEGQPEFVGITNWGPSGRVDQQQKAVYRGPSLDRAIEAVNKMISKKLDKGYRVTHADHDPFLSSEGCRQRVRALVNKR